MSRPFKTNGEKINYVGNKIFQPVSDVLNHKYTTKEFEDRVDMFYSEGYWENIARINDRIFQAVVEFFTGKSSLFTILPLTTRMISSPGAVYGKELKGKIKEKYSYFMKLFNENFENLKYCNFSLLIFQKRYCKEQRELFLCREK